MPRSKTLPIVTALLGVLLAGEAALIWSEWRELAGLRAVAARNQAATQTAERIERHNASLRAAIQEQQSRASSRAKAADARAQAREASSARQQSRARRAAQAWLAALDNKDFRAALATVDRDYNLRTAAPFLRSLGLGPDQVSHVLDLMGELMIAKMDANQSASATGLDAASRASLVVQTQQEIAEQLQSYLGDQAYAALQQWNGMLYQRQIASSLQASLSYTSTPLTDAQAQQLAQAMYQAAPDSAKGDATGLGALQPLWNTANAAPRIRPSDLQAAQSILSPEQMSALQELANQQAAIRALVRSGGL